MDKFQMSDLRELTKPNEGPCITITMPTYPVGADGRQDAVRLKNLAEQAEQQLTEGWMRAPAARDLLEAVRELPSEPDFWKMRTQGLALFLDRAALRSFRVPVRLNELAVVSRQFHLKGLLPLLSSGDRFFILALSLNSVRLLEATEYQVEQVEVAGMPSRMDEALNLDGADPGSQSHFAMKGGKGKQSSVFHGQGGVVDTHKDDVAQFFRMVDAALVPVLRAEQVPLVLAGVDFLLPIFRKACHYTHVVEAKLLGNCDHLGARQIREQAWPLVKPLLTQAREQAADKYRQLSATEKTSDDIRQAIAAAVDGRVETLFVASDREVWGVCDVHGKVIDIHDSQQSDDDELLDLAAIQTLLHGGKVHAVDSGEVPFSKLLAAVMRF